MGKLKGYRTYILGGMAVLGGIVSYLVGDASLMDAADAVFQGLVAMTIRNAIS